MVVEKNDAAKYTSNTSANSRARLDMRRLKLTRMMHDFQVSRLAVVIIKEDLIGPVSLDVRVYRCWLFRPKKNPLSGFGLKGVCSILHLMLDYGLTYLTASATTTNPVVVQTDS